ncbi:MAG: hypothetical protein ACFB16_20500 [Phormidesmis sp.]
MQSFREPTANSLPDLKISLPVPADFLVSLASLPLMSILVSGHRLANSLTQLGTSSEELFRGDRLPSLPLLSSSSKEM